MGLVLSHNLLLEGANSQFAIPEYKRIYMTPFYEQSYIMEMISDMNEDIRQGNMIFLELFNLDFDSLNEGARFEKITKAINSIVQAAIGMVKKAWKIISGIFDKARKNIISTIDSIQKKRPKEVKEMDNPTYVGILSRALNEKDYTISIANIKPTDRLRNPNFPKAKLDAMNRVDFMMHDLSNTTENLSKITDLRATKNLTDSIADNLSEFRKAVGDELFAGYEFDPKNLNISADNIKVEAFGSQGSITVPVTPDLYLQALSNVQTGKEDIDNVLKSKSDIDRNYANLIDILQLISKDINQFYAANIITTGPYAKQAEDFRSIIGSIQGSIAIVQDAINAHVNLISYKFVRVHQIYSGEGSSNKVVKFCDKLVLDYLHKNKGNLSDVVVKSSDDLAFAESVENFNYSLAMIKEAYRELSYNDLLHSVLEDGENNNQQTTTQQTTTTTTTANTNQNTNNIKSKVLNVVDRIVQKFSELWKKFQERTGLLVKADAVWWNRHKIAVSKLDISKVKVNQWYNYDLDKFTRDSYVEWDPNSPDLESDQAMERAIYNKIGGTPTAEDDASFNDKVKTLYYTRYINNQGENSGVEFGSIGMNKQDMDRYLDDFVKGFNGGILKTIRDQSTKLDQDYKRLKSDYQRMAQQYKDNATNNPQQKVEDQNAKTTANQTGEKNVKESFLDILNYEEYIEEAALSSKERNDLPASEFGLPKQRRFPLNDEKHVLLAIRFFNHVEEEYEKELARNIIKKVKAFDMADKVHVGKNNRFKPYWDRSGLANSNVDESSVDELFKFNLADELCLVNNNEATFEVNEELKQQVGNGEGGVNKELDDKIVRFYKLNSQAISVKMTQAIAAYKQYISLYKAVLGSGKEDNKDNNQQANQNQNDNQQK